MQEIDVLEVDEVTRQFGGLFAVRNVSFQVSLGETFGIIGPNGAGKTTLLNCISGLIRPNSGAIKLNGTRIDGVSSRRVAIRGVARTFQLAESFRSFKVIDYVLLGRSVWRPKNLLGCGITMPGTRRGDREQVLIASELIERHGLAEFRDQTLGELAYGHQKVVDIVRALAAEPQLLLLDEPTSGSSREERLHLREIMSDLREKGITVVVVDHDVSFISHCCSRVFAMASGSPMGIGTPEQVLAIPEVIEAYLGGPISS